jgi:hypothetical protein
MSEIIQEHAPCSNLKCWICFRESAALASDLNEPECELSPSAKSTRSANKSSQSTGLASQSTTTLPNSEAPTLGQLTLFAEASLARISASPAREPDWQVPEVDYGSSIPVLLASFDPATSSWRTSQACLVEGWTLFSESWPRSGTMQSGTAYRLPPLVPLTVGTASGSLPTPAATDFKSELMSVDLVRKRQAESTRGVRLTEFLHRKNLPTPNAGNDHWGGRLDEYGGSTNPFRGTEIGQSRLNPCWVEELMGYPIGYTDLGHSEIPSCLRSPKSSDAQS